MVPAGDLAAHRGRWVHDAGRVSMMSCRVSGLDRSHLHLYMDRNPFIRGAGMPGGKPVTWLMPDSIDEGLEGEDETRMSLTKALARSSGQLWYELTSATAGCTSSPRNRPVLDPQAPAARVLDGALRVPLENCGGLQGWYEMLQLRRAKSVDPEHAYLLDWVKAQGLLQSVDPDAFDAGEATMRVQLLDGPRMGRGGCLAGHAAGLCTGPVCRNTLPGGG